ncbi:hypothetical protein ACFQ0M_33655 [Kitasatospora aburaviensis]
MTASVDALLLAADRGVRAPHPAGRTLPPPRPGSGTRRPGPRRGAGAAPCGTPARCSPPKR